MELKTIENGFIPIKELENNNFFIPSYQRGYRWDKEVNALLNDISDFINYKKTDNDFYSLQPIVVKKDENKYIVIDGQQRLTTIFLIIKYIEDKSFFSIEYETRKKSSEFLKNIESKKENEAKNIDFYYFFQAYKNIREFFSSVVNKNDFYNILIDNCKVLWYEIADDEKEEDVFIRLNIGKIPLLAEENIKALFLSKNENKNIKKLERLAEKWYSAEKDLRDNNDFRYCVLSKINSKYIEKNNDTFVLNDDFMRIQVYLNAVKESSKTSFDYFYELYKENKLTDVWDKMEKCINTLKNFSSDNNGTGIERSIFHYIGFLILNDIMNINEIYKLWLDSKKNDLFYKSLLKKIKEHISSLDKDNDVNSYISGLNFYENKKDIFKLLVLFNIDYMLENKSSMRYFEFNRFQLEQWSIEHIYAQNSNSIKDSKKNKDVNEIREWLEEVVKSIEEIDNKIDNTLIDRIKLSISNNSFDDELFDKIDDYYRNDISLNSISNLCLLDKVSNSTIGNMIFSKKRTKIQELARAKKLIPIATEKVFNKEFSNSLGDPNYFLERDREDYMNKIIDHLTKYFKG
ncbi:hypothetical protein SZ52_08075 [Brachyspira hyodysenteriae]|uniref:DUF262 domain-containing protein n=1 Tax=Brachyspira hyodysenteriae TaxID=159 RepID=UPI00063DAE94|nr:DUF262 domain-containing protein [Brachyspira hyodysenteriae]KLI41521.1 hypothetical protein SZ52_08075 [Brachyspira hyodysenteriae]